VATKFIKQRIYDNKQKNNFYLRVVNFNGGGMRQSSAPTERADFAGRVL
jgi:hypothetical protein